MQQLTNWTIGTNEEKQLLANCREIVHKIAPDAQIILYGSRARGDAEPDSDYDLLVLVKQPLTKKLGQEIRYALYDLEREKDIVIDIQVYSWAEWFSKKLQVMPLSKNVEHEGVLA